MRGDPPPSRASRKDVAGTVTRSLERCSADDAERDTLVAGTLQGSGKAAGSATQQDAEAGMLVASTVHGHQRCQVDAPILFNAEGSEGATLTRSNLEKHINNQTPLLAFDTTQITHPENRSRPDDRSPQLAARAHAPTIAGGGMRVRRFTPIECERLQGFGDDYTLVPFNGSPAKDGPRYRAIGNSMAVPVMEWLGRRIDLVRKL
jgi:DNA (cytosine-5)-methyltransferase 1